MVEPTQPAIQPRTMPVEEAARRLGIRINSVYLLLREGRLTGRKINHIWMIDEASVAAQRRRKVVRNA